MPSLKKTSLYLLAAMAIVAVIFVWLWRLDELDAIAKSKNTEQTPLRINAHTISSGPVFQRIMAEGRAQAVRKLSLQFEEPGKVVFIGQDRDGSPLREGSAVYGPGQGSSGQQLARIDSRDKHSDVSQSRANHLAAQRELDALRATLKQAEETLAEARQDHQRKKKLYEQKFLAQNVYEQSRYSSTKAEAALAAAKLRIGSAQARLNRSRAELGKVSRSPEKLELRAPFNGIIARINIKAGDYFQPENVKHSTHADLEATAPMTIIDPGEMEIILNLPEKQGRRVRIGQPTDIAMGFEGWPPGMTYETAPKRQGKIWSVSPQVDGKRRAIRVKARLKQQEHFIQDGMFVTCWIMVNKKENSLRIPLSSLLYDGNQPYAFVCKDGFAQRRNLTIGLRDTRFAEILNGLKAGELVVSSGRKKVVNGAPVTIIAPSQSMENSNE
ncbi:efflux RND transporter periplasmic adaptor subunit [Desulfovibrio sp. JC022]|uniref:efflux RND transporter periplasmic adaptor subunit n=1 Tax=Desulfovibrio sp. JC022 TaxID=2593642 RepID=UPI0013D37A5E|nr:efflux RND transporter periplasmic adaptor subunit [Desulfovibrio sp. JC022]